MASTLVRCQPSRYIFLGFVGIFLAGCAERQDRPAVTQSPKGPTSKPYEIQGQWYFPQPHYELTETGIASHYGHCDGFHGKKTATGERFSKFGLTGAHKTLPLPSVVLVENLENGRKLKLLINDRGPFCKNRILDVSARAADLLGFFAKGTAKVRITTLTQESLALPGNRKKGPAAIFSFIYVASTSSLREAFRVQKHLSGCANGCAPASVQQFPGPIYNIVLGPARTNVAERLLKALHCIGYRDARLISASPRP